MRTSRPRMIKRIIRLSRKKKMNLAAHFLNVIFTTDLSFGQYIFSLHVLRSIRPRSTRLKKTPAQFQKRCDVTPAWVKEHLWMAPRQFHCSDVIITSILSSASAASELLLDRNITMCFPGFAQPTFSWLTEGITESPFFLYLCVCSWARGNSF